MAKESKGSRRYGHGPKIADKGLKSEGTEHRDTKPVEKADKAPKGAVMSGTDGANMTEQPVEQVQKSQVEPGLKETRMYEVPTHEGAAMSTHERHGKELKEMHDRHTKEVTAMHERHADDHKKMAKRHHEEHTAALPESMAPANTAVEGV